MADDKKKKSAEQRFADDFVAEVIEAIKQNEAPWQKSWKSGEISAPYNAQSGNFYSGRNALRLSLRAQREGYEDPRWATAYQINKMNGRINKGEHGTGILYFSQKNEIDTVTGEEKTRQILKHSTVFNIEQSNLPRLTRAEMRETQPDLEAFARLIEHHQPKIQQGEPAYRPSNDTIYMPEKGQFKDDASYYSTVLHEMSHWTGHEDRLHRDLKNRFGTPAYAREELVAELSSYMLSLEHGLPFEPNQSEAYLQHWAQKTGQEMEEALRQGFKEAVNAKNYLDAPLRERSQEQVIETIAELDNTQAQKTQDSAEKFYQEEKEEGAKSARAESTPEKTLPEMVQSAETDKTQASPTLVESISTPSAENTREAQITADFWKAFYADTDTQPLVDIHRQGERTYLAVSWDERHEAKRLGAQWDQENRCWYAMDIDAQPSLSQYLKRFSDYLGQTQGGKTIAEFRVLADSLGLNTRDFSTETGKWHRTSLQGRGIGNKDGAYKLFQNADGTLGGIVKNLATGESINWSNRVAGKKIPKEVQISNDLNGHIQQTIALKVREELQHQRGRVALALYKTLENARGDESYLQNKHIQSKHGIKRLAGGAIVIPLINGEAVGALKGVKKEERYFGVVSLQVILPQEKDNKRLMKDAQKIGAYFPIGSQTAREDPTHIILAEGVATAEAAHQIYSGLADKNSHILAVAAIDSGNLQAVAKTLSEIYPTAEKIIAVDNDLATEQKMGRNTGIESAKHVQANYPDFQLAIPMAIEGKNTDWNDVLVKQGKEIAQNQFAEQLGINTKKDINQIMIAIQLPDLSNLCSRDIGKAAYEATGGDMNKLPQVKSALAEQGYRLDERHFQGISNPIEMKDAFAKAVRKQPTVDKNPTKAKSDHQR